MLPGARLFIDSVNLVTGPGAASGKTTFTRNAIAAVHGQNRSVAVLAVGLEGDRAAGVGAGALPGIATGSSAGFSARGFAGAGSIKNTLPAASKFLFQPGDVFMTTSAYLEAADCQPEILDVLPGSSALGRLALARARRSGSAALVGTEHNEYLALAVSRILENQWASTIFIDGALNRITQAASVGNAQLFYCARVSRSECKSLIDKMRYLLELLSLPLYRSDTDRGEDKAVFIDGALTDSVADRLCNIDGIVVVRDFSRIFLDPQAFRRFGGGAKICVRNRVQFGGFSIILRSISKDEFEKLAGSELTEKIVSWNTWEGGENQNAEA